MLVHVIFAVQVSLLLATRFLQFPTNLKFNHDSLGSLNKHKCKIVLSLLYLLFQIKKIHDIICLNLYQHWNSFLNKQNKRLSVFRPFAIDCYDQRAYHCLEKLERTDSEIYKKKPIGLYACPWYRCLSNSWDIYQPASIKCLKRGKAYYCVYIQLNRTCLYIIYLWIYWE